MTGGRCGCHEDHVTAAWQADTFVTSLVTKSLSHSPRVFVVRLETRQQRVCYIMLKAFNCHSSLQNPPQLKCKMLQPHSYFQPEAISCNSFESCHKWGLDGTRHLEWRNVQSGERRQRLTEWLIFLILVSGLVQWCTGLMPAIRWGLQQDTPRINCLIIVTVSLL